MTALRTTTHSVQWNHAECHILIVKLGVVMLNAIMMIVVAPLVASLSLNQLDERSSANNIKIFLSK